VHAESVQRYSSAQNPLPAALSFAPSTALTPGHNYTWYLGAVSSNGLATTWSPPVNFTIDALPAATPKTPSNTTLAAAAGYEEPTFTWNAVPGAASYSLYVMDNTTGQVAINGANVGNTTSYQLSQAQALAPGHNYTWYIGSVSSNGQATTYNISSPQSFTLAALLAPAPAAPSNNGTLAAVAGYDRPSFAWSGVTGAVSYSLYVVDSTTGQVAINAFNVGNVTTYQLTAAQTLTPGHSYIWYIGAMGANGSTTYNIGNPQTFTLAALLPPTPTGPSNNSILSAAAGGDQPTFTWNSVPGAASYSLYVVDNTTGQVLDLNVGNVIAYRLISLQALTPGHSYTWYVGAVSSNGLVTDWDVLTPQMFLLEQ
jgi:hypothetical protein